MGDGLPMYSAESGVSYNDAGGTSLALLIVLATSSDHD